MISEIYQEKQLRLLTWVSIESYNCCKFVMLLVGLGKLKRACMGLLIIFLGSPILVLKKLHSFFIVVVGKFESPYCSGGICRPNS